MTLRPLSLDRRTPLWAHSTDGTNWLARDYIADRHGITVALTSDEDIIT